MPNHVLDQHLNDPFHEISKAALDTFFNIPGIDYSARVDIFTSGALEAVQEVMVPPVLGCRLSIAKGRFSRVFPDAVARAHALLPQTLPEIDHAATVRTCRLLPPRFFQVLKIGNLRVEGFLPERFFENQRARLFS